MRHSPRRSLRMLLGLAIAAAGFAAPSAGAISPCFTPFLDAPSTVERNGNKYSGGTDADMMWFGDVAGGYRLQAATDQEFGDITFDKNFAPSVSDATVPSLAERTHSFRVMALAKKNVCTNSAWSDTITVIQDATAPQVESTTPSTTICGVPVTPPQPIFCRESEVAIQGTATDAPGGLAPSGVGAAAVTVTLVNTTPVLGASVEPVNRTALVDEDGSWLVRYTGADKPASGTYSVFALGRDLVGNVAAEPAEFGIIVIL